MLHKWIPFILLMACAQSPSHEHSPCEKTRAAFDVGSGRTKMKVAKVDTCESRIVEELLSANEAVGYQADLERSGINTLSRDIQQAGTEALLKLKAQAERFHPDQFSGAATAVFRQADNAARVLTELSAVTGVDLRVITQDEEALLGFSATHRPRSLVWDIGGGSQQFTSRVNGEIMVYKSQVASESFKQELLHIQKRKSHDSPNPVSQSHRFAAERRLNALISDLPPWVSSQAHAQTVIGIGGVLSFALPEVMGLRTYTLSQIERAIDSRLNKNDSQLSGSFSQNSVSNLILVSGIMRHLGISSVESLRLDLTDGLLISERWWSPKNAAQVSNF